MILTEYGKKMRFGAIGVGHLAGAIVNSAIQNGLFEALGYLLYDVSADKLSAFSQGEGARVALVAPGSRRSGRSVLLGVRPGDLESAFEGCEDMNAGAALVVDSGRRSRPKGRRICPRRVCRSRDAQFSITLGCGAAAVRPGAGACRR